jgi:hypothetical protein
LDNAASAESYLFLKAHQLKAPLPGTKAGIGAFL